MIEVGDVVEFMYGDERGPAPGIGVVVTVAYDHADVRIEAAGGFYWRSRVDVRKLSVLELMVLDPRKAKTTAQPRPLPTTRRASDNG